MCVIPDVVRWSTRRSCIDSCNRIVDNLCCLTKLMSKKLCANAPISVIRINLAVPRKDTCIWASNFSCLSLRIFSSEWRSQLKRYTLFGEGSFAVFFNRRSLNCEFCSSSLIRSRTSVSSCPRRRLPSETTRFPSQNRGRPRALRELDRNRSWSPS